MANIEYEYLNDADKNNIVINHIRSVEYNLYNLEIQKVIANTATNKDQQLLTQLEQEISDGQSKIAELKSLLVSE
ncbi:MAG: hypothetical protein EBT95_01665 [Verrucomicrobia bacterium]|nr:hypothetical protein [Verrucomicrobiota bacterium]